MYNGMEAQRLGTETCVCTFRYTLTANAHQISILKLLQQTVVGGIAY